MHDGSAIVVVPSATETSPRRTRRRLALGLTTALVAAVAVTAIGVFARERSEAKLAEWTRRQAVPTVDIVTAKRGVSGQLLVLPGDIEAFYEAPIYARVSGYLRIWFKDIGAHVKAGETLAEIDTPELDQQLQQAKSDLASVQANASLANLTAARWKALLSSQAVSRQTADEKVGDAAEKQALVASAQANVDRLQALKNFARITAPFDGIVTARRTDIGALINGGSGAGTELFKVADTHEMRVYVQVPQAYAADLRPGTLATLKVPQYPGTVFNAKLTTTSNAVARDSRTVLVELAAGNKAGKLWPGTFAEVQFELPPDPDVYRLPTSATVFGENGLEVATVGADDKVQLKPITVGRDLGTEVEVTAGVSPGDWVIKHPPDSIAEGDQVRVAQAAQASAAKLNASSSGNRSARVDE